MNAWNYFVGQCTRWAATLASWIPAGLGNAKDWLFNAQRKGLPTSPYPVPGAVAVYGPGQGYDPAGHVAYVESVDPASRTFVVSEMNYGVGNRVGMVDMRRSTLAGVQGFILPPGSAAQLTGWGPGGILPGPGDVVGAAGSAAVGAVFGGLTDLLTGIAHNAEVVAQRQIVAIAVATVVLIVLFIL